MPNILNQMIRDELVTLFDEAQSCIVVDFQGLNVESINEFRSTLRKNEINMQVVKTTLACKILEELDVTDFEEVFSGPSAVIWGGQDIVQLSKAVNDFARKHKKLKIKGGLLERSAIDKKQVTILVDIPDMPMLLTSIAAGIASPLQSIHNAMNSLFTSIGYAIDAVREKKEDGEDAS